MHAILSILLLLADPQAATATAMDYSEAKRLADADEAAVTGPAKAELLAAQAALLDAGVAECNRFDLREFNDAVLATGSVPLAVLAVTAPGLAAHPNTC